MSRGGAPELGEDQGGSSGEGKSIAEPRILTGQQRQCLKVAEPTLPFRSGGTRCSFRSLSCLSEALFRCQQRLTCAIETQFGEAQLRSQTFHSEPDRERVVPQLISKKDRVGGRFGRIVGIGPGIRASLTGLFQPLCIVDLLVLASDNEVEKCSPFEEFILRGAGRSTGRESLRRAYGLQLRISLCTLLSQLV